jgi:hypothetical protein
MPAILQDRTDRHILTLIQAWVDLLAQGKGSEAVAMLVPPDRWTPNLLATVVGTTGSSTLGRGSSARSGALCRTW